MIDIYITNKKERKSLRSPQKIQAHETTHEMSNNNYSITDDFVYKNKKYFIDEVATELKNDLKALLNLKRTPRNLHIFSVFYKQYNLQKSTNAPVFISTNLLKNRFKLNERDYSQYFDTFVAEWEDETYSYINKQCREIKSFTPEFIALCEKYAGIQFTKDFYKNYYYSIKEFSNDQINHLRKIFNRLNQEEREEKSIGGTLREKTEINQKQNREERQSISSTLRNEEFESIISEDFYHSTEDSPFRIYHKLQSLTRTVKSQMFTGYYDIDLHQCFASIAWNILDMQNCSLPFAWLLNPQLKNEFREKVKSDFHLETITQAKQKICSLFTESWTTGEKDVEWYNQLHFEIKRRARQHLGKKVLWNGQEVLIDTMHKLFTYHEQMIIAKLSEECNVILNMHDGIISTNRPKENHVEYLGFKFLLSIDQFVDIIFVKEEHVPVGHQEEMTKPPFKEASSTVLLLNRSKAVETDYIIYNARMHARGATYLCRTTVLFERA